MFWVKFILIAYVISLLLLTMYEYYVYEGRYPWWRCIQTMPEVFYIPVINTVMVFVALYDVIVGLGKE